MKDLDPFLISSLISKYTLGKLNLEEERLLADWLELSLENRKLFEYYLDDQRLHRDLQLMDSIDMQDDWKKILNKINNKNKPHSLVKYWKYVAVATLLLIGSSTFLFFNKKDDPGIVADRSGHFLNDVLPSERKARLILSDGKSVDMNKDENTIAGEDGAPIHYSNGKVIYAYSSGNTSSQDLVYNTLIVPKGGKYEIILPDGTEVWLNGESELRFPVHFDKNKRKVFLKGEAYFIVAKKKNSPFLLEAAGSLIEVLGTEFNVKATEKDIKTTLLEGSVKLSNDSGTSVLLKPGEMGRSRNAAIKVQKADLRKVMAWKNGEFYFKKDRLSGILQQVAQWYDLEVELEEGMGDLRISGSIDRKVRLSEVLTMLKYVTNGDFEIKGRKLKVSKK